MTEYRAPREWHIEPRFGRFYVTDQFGGFEGWHDTWEDADAAANAYVERYGDTYNRRWA